MSEVGHGVASGNVGVIEGENVVKLEPHDGSSEAVDASVVGWIDDVVTGQLRQNSVVLLDPPRFVVGD